MNALVMYDRESDTLWSQFLGEAVEGSLKGTKLEFIPSQLVTWAEWKERHPEHMVLDKGFDPSSYDHYQSYYFSGQTGVIGESNPDSRLHPKDLVVGIVGESSERAYAYRDMSRNRAINDTFEGNPVVVTLTTDAGATTVFARTVDGKTLTFESSSEMEMTDEETGSVWDKATGEALSGPLEGTQLEQIRSFATFWFSWSDFYPLTELYSP